MLHVGHGILVALIAIGVGRLASNAGAVENSRPAAHGSAAHPARSTSHSGSSESTARHRARQERAWRDWYNRYRRVVRPGYIYPPGYPPGYNRDSNPPTTGPSGGANNGVVGAAAAGNNGALFHNPAVNGPAADDATPAPPPPVDPDVLAAVARVKAACLARSDYQAAVAQKKTAEDQLSGLRKDGQDIDPSVAMPLAKTALDASTQISAIELEETTKDAQTAAAQPPAKAAEAAAK